MFNNFIYNLKEKIAFENVNKLIFSSALMILVFGIFSFFSAAIGFLNKVENEQFFTNFIKTQMIAYVIGFIMLSVIYLISSKLLSKLSVYMYILSIFLCLLIFIPGMEISHGGGVRWINVFGFSLQPADILKFTCIVIFSVYFSKYKRYTSEFKYGLAYPALVLVPVVIVFFLQRDLGSLAIILFVIGAMYFLNKTRISYIYIAITFVVAIVFAYSMLNSYVKDRFTGVKEESYQTKQSLIALGSGGVLGRGYGQSVQKFFYLPEPAGDSIFAVVGEELGFVGTLTLSLLFFFLIINSVLVARGTSDTFTRNMIYGISFLFFAQFIMNTGSMTKIIPLSGDTLPFFSKGGTAIIMNMMELGLLLKLTRRDIIKSNI